MRPQSYCGGCTPSPRKLSPASASNASPAAISHRDQKRLRDIREDVPPHQPERARRRACARQQVVGACHRGCERLAEPREVRCDGHRDADHRSLRTDADHRRDEDRNEQRGNATVRLMNPVTSRPTRPPTSAGTAPSGMPINAPRPAARMASMTDSRVATSTRWKMSRPSVSVPNQCALLAPCDAFRMSRRDASSDQRIGRDDSEDDDRGEAECRRDPTGVRTAWPKRLVRGSLTSRGSSSVGR